MLFLIKLKRFPKEREGIVSYWKNGQVGLRLDPKSVEAQQFPETEVESITPAPVGAVKLFVETKVTKVTKKKAKKKVVKKK